MSPDTTVDSRNLPLQNPPEASMPESTPSTDDLMAVFDRLQAAYGPLHWWPGESPFEIAIGAVLAQNTAWRRTGRDFQTMEAVYRMPNGAIIRRE